MGGDGAATEGQKVLGRGWVEHVLFSKKCGTDVENVACQEPEGKEPGWAFKTLA